MKFLIILLALLMLGLIGVFMITFPRASVTNAENDARFEDMPAGPRTDDPSNDLRSLEIDSLPTDSEFAGTYIAVRTFKGQSWDDMGTFTPSDALLLPSVGINFAEEMILRARPDYEWVWHEAGTIRQAGYYLEKKD